QLINFLFGTVVIALFLFLYGIMPTWRIVYFPVILIVTLAFLLAVGSVLGFFTVFVRDIDNLLGHVIRIFFYASPIIWEGGRLPPEYGIFVAINPIAIIVNSYRDILMYHQTPNFISLGIIFVLSII